GRHVAVAGNRNNEIWVYANADLVQGRGEPQILRSAGSTVDLVRFVKKGDDLGLLLRDAALAQPNAGKVPGPADVVFDFGQRRLAANPAEWAVASLPASGWSANLQVTREPDGRIKQQTVLVTQNNGPVHQLDVRPDRVVTGLALLPPGRVKVPIVAVAFDELG